MMHRATSRALAVCNGRRELCLCLELTVMTIRFSIVSLLRLGRSDGPSHAWQYLHKTAIHFKKTAHQGRALGNSGYRSSLPIGR